MSAFWSDQQQWMNHCRRTSESLYSPACYIYYTFWPWPHTQGSSKCTAQGDTTFLRGIGQKTCTQQGRTTVHAPRTNIKYGISVSCKNPSCCPTWFVAIDILHPISETSLVNFLILVSTDRYLNCTGIISAVQFRWSILQLYFQTTGYYSMTSQITY